MSQDPVDLSLRQGQKRAQKAHEAADSSLWTVENMLRESIEEAKDCDRAILILSSPDGKTWSHVVNCKTPDATSMLDFTKWNIMKESWG